MQYAAENWGHHLCIAFTDLGRNPDPCLATVDCHSQKRDDSWNLKQLIPDFLGKMPNISCANEVIHHVKTRFNIWDNQTRSPKDVTELHIAASLGIRYFGEYYMNQGVEIGASDFEGMTALHKAAKNGHEEIVRLLLDSGAAIEPLDRKGRSALAWSVSTNKLSVSRLLLQRSSECGFESIYGSGVSGTSIAATAGHEEMLDLLAEYETDDFKRNQLMREAFHNSGYGGVSRLLLHGGQRWAISEESLAEAMTVATSGRHVRTMQVLLGADVYVNSPLPSGPRSLAEAPAQYNLEGTQHFLTAGADASLEDDGGDLPLHTTVRSIKVRPLALLHIRVHMCTPVTQSAKQPCLFWQDTPVPFLGIHSPAEL